MSSQIPVVLIFSSGRCGTNHLIRLLRSFPNLAARGEIFNNSSAWGLIPRDIESLSLAFGQTFEERSDVAMIDAIKSDPVKVLKIVLDGIGEQKQILVTKVLTGQLRAKSVATIIDSELNIIPVFLRRKLINSYISALKARTLNEWHGVDTTDVKPELKIEEFTKYINRQQKWHSRIDEILAQRDICPAVLDYESDINCNEAECLERFARALGPENFPGAPVVRSGTEKQDRNDDCKDKCTNWEEFTEVLRQHSLYDRAMSPVQLRPISAAQP